MRSIKVLLVILVIQPHALFAQVATGPADKKSSAIEWPVVKGSETKPWTWWWWHGSAADTFNISKSLTSFSKTGMGGVNLVFILDIKDSLAPRVEFLSKK